MKNRKSFLIFVLCWFAFFQVQQQAFALDTFSTLKQWWSQHAIDIVPQKTTPLFVTKETDPEMSDEVPSYEEAEEDAEPVNPGDQAFIRDASCIVPSAPPRVDCQNSGDQLCLEYSSGGTTKSKFLLKGKVDLTQHFSGLLLSVQNSYTRETSVIDRLESRDVCDASTTRDQEICIDDSGNFSTLLHFDDFGPYTIIANASFSQSGSIQKQIKMSRVIPIERDKVELSFSPQLGSEVLAQSTHLNITADLLKSCVNCDFIGAATAGVKVVAHNRNAQEGEQSKNIDCVHSASQVDGKYTIGVPLQAGENNITLTICNAALEENDACLNYGPFIINKAGSQKEFEILSPEERDFYSSSQYPEIQYKFRFADKTLPVKVQLNHQEEKEIHAGSNGIYSINIAPQPGVNILSFVQGDKRKTISFTWGELVVANPQTNQLEIENAASLFLKASFVEKELQPLLSNYLRSDEFKTLLTSFVKTNLDHETMNDNEDLQVEMPAIPHCAVSDKKSPYTFSLSEAPEIENIEIQNIDFSENQFSFRVKIDRLRAHMKMSVDNKGKQFTLPMLISFQKLILDLEVQNKRDDNGQPYVLVNAPKNDCDFRSQLYCDNRPSSLTPDNYLGDATKYRHIIRCEEEKVSGETLKICRGLNALDAQTAAISTQVFETINEQIYCSGSKAITSLMYKGVDANISAPISFLKNELKLPMKFRLGQQFAFRNDGIYLPLDLSLEAEGKNKKGILISSEKLIPEGQYDKNITADLGFDLVNSFLFSLTSHYPEDALVYYDDVLVNADGITLSERCGDTGVEIKKEDAILCQLRPRVLELLGTSLSEGNYLEKDQPLLLKFRMDTRHVPQLHAKDERHFELQVSGLRVDFYALEYEKNEDGSLQLHYDRDGNPLIKSMRPEVSSPEEGQIISAQLSLLIGIELGQLSLHPEDTASLALPIKIVQEETKLFLDPIPGTNATQIPGELLTGSVLGKLQIGLDSFSKDWIYIPGAGVLKKQFDIPSSLRELLLGTSRLHFVSDGFGVKVDDRNNSIKIGVNPVMSQVLHYEGKREVYRFE